MNKRRLLTASLGLFTVIVLACGEAATLADGVVVDSNGKPVGGVEVVMESEIAGGFRKESEQKTSEDGKFNFVSITGAARVIRLRFTKEGYQEKTKTIPALEKSTHEIVLDEK